MSLLEQIQSPPVALALAIYASLALWPLIALWRCVDVVRWRLAVAGVVATIALSLVHLTTTPDGVIRDTWEYLPLMRRPLDWWIWNRGDMAWWKLSQYVGWQLSGSFLAERVVGLGWHCLSVVALVTLLTKEA